MVKSGCYNPFYKKGDPQPIPCGKCPKCRRRKISGWSFRIMQQHKVSDRAYFITLTYNDANLPLSKNGHMDLCKKHLQLFFKRLRKAHEKERGGLVVKSNGALSKRWQSIKYHAVGEYGGTSNRPHYHLLLFNCKFELIQDAWTNPITGKHIGHVNYGDQRGVSGGSVGYCMKYMEKPSRVSDKYYRYNVFGRYKKDDRQKEFALVSKGMGLSYLTPEVRAWHLAKMVDRMYINIGQGKKAAMPRYYKLKLYSDLQRQEAIEIQNQQLIIKQLEDLLRKDAGIIWKEQRDQDEKIKAAYRKMHSSDTKTTV